MSSETDYVWCEMFSVGVRTDPQIFLEIRLLTTKVQFFTQSVVRTKSVFPMGEARGSEKEKHRAVAATGWERHTMLTRRIHMQLETGDREMSALARVKESGSEEIERTRARDTLTVDWQSTSLSLSRSHTHTHLQHSNATHSTIGGHTIPL